MYTYIVYFHVIVIKNDTTTTFVVILQLHVHVHVCTSFKHRNMSVPFFPHIFLVEGLDMACGKKPSLSVQLPTPPGTAIPHVLGVQNHSDLISLLKTQLSVKLCMVTLGSLHLVARSG